MVNGFDLNSIQCYVKIFILMFTIEDATLNISFVTLGKTCNFASKF